MEEFEKLVRLRLITHNARLVDARKERGLTQREMAKRVGIHWTTLSAIENLRRIPTEDEIAKISCFLEKTIDYLFPESLLDSMKAGVFSRREAELNVSQVVSLTQAHLRFLIEPDIAETVEDKVDKSLFLPEAVEKALATLPPRLQRLLRLRYGLADGRCRTFKEVGKELGVSRTRVQHMESKAFKLLRHRSRSKILKAYL